MHWTKRKWLKAGAATVVSMALYRCYAIGKQELAIAAEYENLYHKSAVATDTHGLHQEANVSPSLSQIRKCVGQLLCGDEPIGSCVLLDDRTVVMSAHEVEGSDGGFSVSILRAPSDYVSAALTDLVLDSKHDLAFATIVDQGFSKKNGLVPARMAETIEEGSDIVILGFPYQLRRLHATRGSAGNIVEFTDSLTRRIHCKAEGQAFSHPGMSGGGVFCADRFLGILNAGDQRGIIFFTPVKIIRTAYLELYPYRAREAGIKALPDTASRPMPSACDIGRRNFLALRPTQG